METNVLIQKISVRVLLRFLTAYLVCLFLAAVATQWIGWKTGHWGLWGLTTLVNMDGDANLPTWFNMFLLVLAAWLCEVVRCQPSQDQKAKFHWGFLAVVFFLMSVDEVACVHEAIGRAVTDRFETHGLFYYGFVIPGAILALGVFVFSLRFLNSLPRKIAAGMVLSGFLYILGAAGIEAVSGAFAEVHGTHHIIYKLLADVEELLEMGALILLLNVLFGHLRSITGKKTLDCLVRLEF